LGTLTLKECPFCGFDDVTVVAGGKLTVKGPYEPLFYVWCFECGARGPEAKREATAIAKWNDATKRENNAQAKDD
jgi:Lar family restriction alleviation protein